MRGRRPQPPTARMPEPEEYGEDLEYGEDQEYKEYKENEEYKEYMGDEGYVFLAR
jgi:hypothetical protein